MNASFLTVTFWILASALLLFAAYRWWFKYVFSRKNPELEEKTLIEDALKHLFDNEYKSLISTALSLSSSLKISKEQTHSLLLRMETMNLATKIGEDQLQLTTEGRAYALKVIRIHRIWERYLADETGYHEDHWHNNADQVEHKMTLSQANEIAFRLGDPVFDPHGDPIPGVDGTLPAFEGVPLSEVTPGEIARIIHVEDEPLPVYQQLLAMGLFPGLEIKVLQIDHQKISFIADGEEKILIPAFAGHITVKPQPYTAFNEQKSLTLTDVPLGSKAIVTGISAVCRRQHKRRLMDLGVVPGTEIEVMLESAGKNPRAYRMLNTIIALRNQQASMVLVEPLKAS
ncbi:MAG TPA: hypothetical protein DCX89_04175 [Saprospirales bacterium]|nr:hypothetical protein [Saprospirales bacterium]HAY71063.1 hypothetical protein [Saprospirales bacterium]HRQ29526.1 FeoA domain-containing protein [Saprospiraceae bacterium]